MAPHPPSRRLSDLSDVVRTALEGSRRVAECAAVLATDPTAPVGDLIHACEKRDLAFTELGRRVVARLGQGLEVNLAAPAPDGPRTMATAHPPVPVSHEPTTPAPTPFDTESEEHDTDEITEYGAPVTVAPPRPKAPPPSPSSLDALQAGFGSPAWVQPSTANPDEARRLAGAWGHPNDRPSPGDVERISTASRRLDDWLPLQKAQQRRLLAYATARSRQVQDADTHAPESCDAVFRRLTAWSKDREPGYVYGLRLDHLPRQGTWTDEAKLAWEAVAGGSEGPAGDPPFTLGDLVSALEDGVDDDGLAQMVIPLIDHPGTDQDHLVQVLAPHIARLKGDRHLKRLRKRIAKREKDRQSNVSSGGGAALPEAWPWYVTTRQRRVVMVGGDDRDAARQRIQHTFDFATLHWESGFDMRRLESLGDRIRSGSVDMVLLIRRYLSHKASDHIVPACKETGVPFVPVADGYGTTAIRSAIEKHVSV